MGLSDRLDDAASPTMALLPDGSVDHRYGVLGRGDDSVTRAAFAQRVADGEQAFEIVSLGVEPGGKAVNASVQAGALGADAMLFGHLDHGVFDDLEVEAHSMGAPATVNVYEFRDDAVMLTAPSADVQRWGYDDLLEGGGGRALDADAVVWCNWGSLPNATDALCRAAERDGSGGTFVLDPGGVSGRSADDVSGLFNALTSLEERYSVVVSANERELRALGGTDGSTDEEGLLRRVRERADVTATVVHGVDRAVASTVDGTVAVENFEVESTARFTGGGDRFSAALGFALANDWGFEPALRLGNACASYYVENGSTGDADDVAAFATEATG